MARRRFQAPRIEQRTNGTYFIRPYVDVITEDGSLKREKRVFDLAGATNKVEAKRMASEIMSKVNSPDVIVLSQLDFGTLLDLYITRHVEKQLGAGTQSKYKTHIKNHIRPFFGPMKLNEIKTLRLQEYFDAKAAAGLSWNTRTDIRNIMSGIFERAIAWDLWKQENPVRRVIMGRKKFVYEHREWSEEETRMLLNALPNDVRILCMTALQSTLRISELLGLREGHVTFTPEGALLKVQERFYRGNVDDTKTNSSKRSAPLGPWLTAQLKALCTGDPERHLFHIATRPGWGTDSKFTRDDRSIHRYFLKPAAEKLGLYSKGFGFHDLRREAITRWEDKAGLAQATKLAGHTRPVMTTHYTKQEMRQLRPLVNAMEERMMGASQTVQ